MQLKPVPPCRRRGFTILEMLGVLVVIIALCALLVPALYRVMDDARLAADLRSIDNLKRATEEYFKTKGTFAGPNGAVLTWTNNAYEYWDREVLFKERFTDRLFQTKLGSDAYIRLVKITAASGTAITSAANTGHLGSFNCNNGLYDLTSQYALNLTPGVCQDAYALARPPGPPPSAGRWLDALKLIGREPLMACYNLPGGTDPPPPVPGGGDPPPDVQYPGFDPYSTRTTFAAADPNNPVIVAEVVIENCRVGDAFRLSVAMESYAQSIWAYYDVLGRVKYDMYDANGPTKKGAVFIYLGRVPPQ